LNPENHENRKSKHEMQFTHKLILQNAAVTAAYINELSGVLPLSLGKLITKAHELCPEIKAFCDSNIMSARMAKDKGLTGKKVEFFVFGRLPNNESNADTTFGDIKATHIKKFRKLGYNAKERLTLTNCGSTGDYATLQHILDSPTLRSSSRYCKIQTGILCVLEQPTTDVTDLDEIVRYLFRYDITELPVELQNVLETDYQKIRKCVQDRAVSQAGQTYLHIHPHGAGHGSTTRAFGFTNKFVTALIGHYGKLPLVTRGRSLYF
jgi:hypothetical protein